MKIFFSILLLTASANASYFCPQTDFGKKAEQTFECSSNTGSNVCIRIESSVSGQRKIQVKNESDSYNQYFQETKTDDACKKPEVGALEHCRLSKINIESNSVTATTSTLSFESNSIHRAAFLFDKSTLQGKFNLLSRLEFENDWTINDSFVNCRLVK